MPVILQGFNWNSWNNSKHYNNLHNNMKKIKSAGVNKIWLPPPSRSRDPEGYFIT